jgi:hypothetical protein
MDLDDLDLQGNVRLKFFLARRADGRQSRRGPNRSNSLLTEQDAAILAALFWMKTFSGRELQQREICQLLGMPPKSTRLSTVIGGLRKRGLIEEGSNAITSEGRNALAQFADQVLGTPQAVEEKLAENHAYRDLISYARTLIDEHLTEKFASAIAPRARHTAENSRSRSR